MTEYSKKIIFKLLFFIASAVVIVIPSLFSGMCYRHCTAPKDFALMMGAASGGLTVSLYLLVTAFAGEKAQMKVAATSFLYPAFAVLSFASLAVTPSFAPGVEKCMELSVLTIWFAIFIWLTREDRRTERLLAFVLASAFFPALIMVAETFGWRAIVLWENIESSGLMARETMVSTFGNPDFAAPFFGLASLINIRYLIYSESISKKIVFSLLQVLFLSAWLLPMCRSSQIALLVSFALYFYFVRRHNPALTASLVNVLFLVVIVFFTVQLKDMIGGASETTFSRISELFVSRDTTGKRLFMLAIGWQMIKSSPFVGTGAGALLLNFPVFSSSFDQTSEFWNSVLYSFNTGHLHNEFVNIASETGLVTFMIFLAFVSGLIYRGSAYCVAADSSKRKNERSSLVAALTCCLLFIIVDSMFNVTMSLSHMSLLFVFFAAALLNSGSFENKRYFTLNFNSAPLRLSIVGLLLLFGIFASLSSLRNIRADWYLMQGKVFEQVSREKDAIRCYEASAELRPAKAEPLYFAALLYGNFGEFDRAISLLKSASNVNLSLPIVYELARLAVRHLDLNSEFRYLLFLTRAYPRFDEGHYLLGLRYLKEKTSNPVAGQMAMASFDRAIELNPRHIPARMSRVESFFQRREYAKASSELDEVLKIDPKLRNALYMKSIIPGYFF